eukprot:scaffold62599_cov66-Phaeocystis_antarctica.AAC.11
MRCPPRASISNLTLYISGLGAALEYRSCCLNSHVSRFSAAPVAQRRRLRSGVSHRRSGCMWRRWHRRYRKFLGEAAYHAAKAEVRNERLGLQRGTRGWRGVLGAEPLRDGLALVGEPVHRADRVGHDLGGDRAH